MMYLDQTKFLSVFIRAELKTFEWWISGLRVNPLFFLISRLSIACSPLIFNLQINYPIRIRYPILKFSALKTLEWINFNPDFLIRISTVETFHFCRNPLFFSLLGYPLIVFSIENISVLSLVARFSLIGC